MYKDRFHYIYACFGNFRVLHFIFRDHLTKFSVFMQFRDFMCNLLKKFAICFHDRKTIFILFCNRFLKSAIFLVYDRLTKTSVFFFFSHGRLKKLAIIFRDNCRNELAFTRQIGKIHDFFFQNRLTH